MDKKKFQFYYGIVLTLMGVGVFYRIPEAMVRVETMNFFQNRLLAVKVCLALLGVALIVAGIKKITKYYK